MIMLITVIYLILLGIYNQLHPLTTVQSYVTGPIVASILVVIYILNETGYLKDIINKIRRK